MGLSTKVKDILNKFADSMIALRLPGEPFATSNPKLGDSLDAAYASAKKTASATYDFAYHGGAIGSISLDMALPAGSIITELYTDALTSMASGGAATVALSIGADSLKAATAYNDASYVGLDKQTLSPLKSALGGDLTMVIAGAALTDGKVRVIVSYIEP